ncbi:serine/threonine protein kinase [Nonomuraea endophytica]|uniref:non-specific serine/threonine protein kinase n=1 Tax=Nonomuraea endophytica TaxID=714136 RepID=A0A7W8EKM4_9ACTN|nr:serine/threonine-protein kinase [Nonomuraea endophytica]MBB5082944.1 serine/threonine protein kinase [Nonomuraea endophytica]
MSADRVLSGPGAEGVPQSQGRLIGRRYRLMSPVGRGGMGMVWHAHDVLLDRAVAVKELILPYGLDHSGAQVANRRMLREARSAARLTHPGIVTVHDVVEEDGRPWIVMELVRAWSLEQAVRQSGPLPVIQAAEIGIRVLDALRHAHAAGILHRDVKPGNVLLTSDRVVLTDFGIAAIEGDVTITQTGLLMGSPAYIPPERLSGQPITQAADLWSFGATLYAAVEGRPPYEGPDAIAVLGAVLTQDPIRPQRAGALLGVIEGLLRKNPAERMAAAQVAEQLEKVLHAHGSRPPRGPETSRLPTQADPTPVGLLPPLEPPSGPMPSRIVETPSGPVRVPYDPLKSPSGGYVMPYDGLASPSGSHNTQQIQQPGTSFDAFTSHSGPLPAGGYDSLAGTQDPLPPLPLATPGPHPQPTRPPLPGHLSQTGHPPSPGHLSQTGHPPQTGHAPLTGHPQPGGQSPSGAHDLRSPSGPHDLRSPSSPHDPFAAQPQPDAHDFRSPSGPHDLRSPSGPHAFSGPQSSSGSHDLRSPSGGVSSPVGPPSLESASGPGIVQPTFGGVSGPQPILPLTSDVRSAPWPLASADDLREQSRDLSRGLGASRTSKAPERLTRSRRRPADDGSGWMRDGRPTPRLIITALTGVGAVAVAIWLLTSGGTSTPPTAASTAPSSSSSTAPEPSVATVPDGYREHTAAGFTAALPDTWKAATADGAATFTGPKDSGMKITVQQTAPQPDGGVAELSKEEADGGVEGYIQVQLQALEWRGWKSADWEYTYALENGVPMHALTRFVSIDDAAAYKITFAIPELKWDDQTETRNTFLSTFRPAT